MYLSKCVKKSIFVPSKIKCQMLKPNAKLKIFGIFQIENLSNFSNMKFLEWSKLENWEISSFFFDLENQSLASKIGNFGIIHPFDISHYSQFFQFSYLPSDINQFRHFNFSTFISYSIRKFLDWQIHKTIKFLKLFNFEN